MVAFTTYEVFGQPAPQEQKKLDAAQAVRAGDSRSAGQHDGNSLSRQLERPYKESRRWRAS